MPIDLEALVGRMEAGAAAIAGLARGLTPEEARWKPSPEAWSAVEVVCHLYDEEREDFRQRLDLTLHRPEEPLPPNDPEGWVTARDYQSRDIGEMLERFLEEREHSLEWLLALDEPDWERRCNHPQLGHLRAGDFLVSWAAHDLLHVRQLVELRYERLAADAAPYQVAYAGDW